MPAYYVYVLTNRSGTLYVGVTNDLERRLAEHKSGAGSFTARYKIDRLVYFEETSDVRDAIAREKQIKGWTRKRKIELIAGVNPRCGTSAKSGRTVCRDVFVVRQILRFTQNDNA